MEVLLDVHVLATDKKTNVITHRILGCERRKLNNQ